MTVRVKICGVTRIEDAECAIAAGADIIGLNFYSPSPRAIDLHAASRIRNAIGSRCEVVGVFVNADRDYIAQRLARLKLDLLQFHGDEPQHLLCGWPVKVIRALRLAAAPSVASLDNETADYFLLDTFDPDLFGGTGRARNLAGLAGLDLSRIFLSGGLNPDNVAAAARLEPYAVDVASGVESAPGIKDHAKLRSFITNAKSA
jgi:phosphoribosylanthranilate isomerase